MYIHSVRDMLSYCSGRVLKLFLAICISLNEIWPSMTCNHSLSSLYCVVLRSHTNSFCGSASVALPSNFIKHIEGVNLWKSQMKVQHWSDGVCGDGVQYPTIEKSSPDISLIRCQLQQRVSCGSMHLMCTSLSWNTKVCSTKIWHFLPYLASEPFYV